MILNKNPYGQNLTMGLNMTFVKPHVFVHISMMMNNMKEKGEGELIVKEVRAEALVLMMKNHRCKLILN